MPLAPFIAPSPFRQTLWYGYLQGHPDEDGGAEVPCSQGGAGLGRGGGCLSKGCTRLASCAYSTTVKSVRSSSAKVVTSLSRMVARHHVCGAVRIFRATAAVCMCVQYGTCTVQVVMMPGEANLADKTTLSKIMSTFAWFTGRCSQSKWMLVLFTSH